MKNETGKRKKWEGEDYGGYYAYAQKNPG